MTYDGDTVLFQRNKQVCNYWGNTYKLLEVRDQGSFQTVDGQQRWFLQSGNLRRFLHHFNAVVYCVFEFLPTLQILTLQTRISFPVWRSSWQKQFKWGSHCGKEFLFRGIEPILLFERPQQTRAVYKSSRRLCWKIKKVYSVK